MVLTMENPLFSIITITFNAAAELRPTMESVAGQTCRDFEHILVDGASRDNTVALARELGGENLRIISERDKGLYDAMNKGIRMARGKYLIFLNAGDTFSAHDTLEHYASAAREHDADIIYGDTLIVDEHRQVIRRRHLSAPEVLTFESFSEGMLICHQAFVVKKSIAPEYDLKYRFSADYDWTVRCIRKTTPEKCHNLHEVTIHYLDAGMTEKNKVASLRERFEVMSNHYGRGKAVARHLSFIPRAIARKIKS